MKFELKEFQEVKCGELRAELAGDRASRHTELREWLAG